MRRNFPFVLQHDSMQCGIACLAMICSYFKKDKSMDYLSEQCFATTEGVSLLAIDKVASQLGLETVSGRVSVNTICNLENLCILHWNQNLHNPINEYFRTAKNRLMLTYRNISHSQFYGGYLQGQIKPFGNDIVHLNVFVQPYWEKVAMPEGTFTHFSLENQFSVSVNYKQWILNYEYVIPSYTVSGLFRSLSENNSNLIVAYKYKNWRFTAGVLFLGKDAHYRTETLGVSPVKYHSDRRIRDNNTMFVIGASYHFHTGKQKQVSRKLKNADFTAPSF